MRQSGFTLLELSIVLVIIGLIIGGVTVGAELVRQAELQALGKDVYRYQTAIQTFKLKYAYLPGDLPSAYNYWPSSGSNAVNCQNSGGLNGNGNGEINGANWINNSEQFRIWQHLTLSNIIQSVNNGGTISVNGVEWGVTNPESPIKGVGYNLQYTTNCDGNSFTVNGRKGHYFEIASRGETNGKTGDAGKMWAGGAVNPAEAASLDQKLDDGLYNAGKWTAQDAVSGCQGTNGAYGVSNTGQICTLFYWPVM